MELWWFDERKGRGGFGVSVLNRLWRFSTLRICNHISVDCETAVMWKFTSPKKRKKKELLVDTQVIFAFRAQVHYLKRKRKGSALLCSLRHLCPPLRCQPTCIKARGWEGGGHAAIVYDQFKLCRVQYSLKLKAAFTWHLWAIKILQDLGTKKNSAWNSSFCWSFKMTWNDKKTPKKHWICIMTVHEVE